MKKLLLLFGLILLSACGQTKPPVDEDPTDPPGETLLTKAKLQQIIDEGYQLYLDSQKVSFKLTVESDTTASITMQYDIQNKQLAYQMIGNHVYEVYLKDGYEYIHSNNEQYYQPQTDTDWYKTYNFYTITTPFKTLMDTIFSEEGVVSYDDKYVITTDTYQMHLRFEASVFEIVISYEKDGKTHVSTLSLLSIDDAVSYPDLSAYQLKEGI